MKRRIKDPYLRNIRHNRLAGIDADNIRWIVQRRIGRAFFQSRHNFIINKRGAGKFFSSMDDPMAYRINRIHSFDDTAAGISQAIQHQFDRHLMIRYGLLNDLLLTIPLMRQLRIRKPDFFN